MSWKGKGKHFWEIKMVWQCFSIFLEVHIETEKGQSSFCSWCVFSSVLIFFFFENSSRSRGRKVRGEHIKIAFLVGLKLINFGLVTFDLGHSFYKPVGFFVCLGFSSPTPWSFISFCCFFGFSLSSILSHSRLQSKEFFPICVLSGLLSLNDASPRGLGHLILPHFFQ